ncbi:MAG: DUF4012 domain-containing protein [Candidatus Woesebacteria bacterium]|jgi:hypothetical protein
MPDKKTALNPETEEKKVESPTVTVETLDKTKEDSKKIESNVSNYKEKETIKKLGFKARLKKFLKRSEKTAKTTSKDDKPKKKRKLSKAKKILLVFLLIFLMLGATASVLAYYSYSTAMEMKHQAAEAKIIAKEAYDLFKAQNLPEVEKKVADLKVKLEEIKSTYYKLAFYKKIPVANKYFEDGEHGLKAAEHALNGGSKAVAAIAPYADVLGFEGEGSFEGGTAENRIKMMIETLDKIMPSFDEIIGDFSKAEQELAMIDANRYPETIKGIVIRPRLVQTQESVKEAVKTITDFRPVLEQLPSIAGGKGERKKYLILFQNDNELRPTGGFLTAYAVVFIEDGKVTPEKSDDIYELDKKFRKKIDIPEALGRYLITEKYWNLRDMNISPDFKLSMDQFFEHYQTVKGEPENIDGIMAVDTNVLTGLLQILGPVEIPGGGTFSAENDPRCDCPQVVYALSEIITKPTPYLREDRKGILGPLMQAILQKAYDAPKQQWPSLFQFAWGSMEARYLQMYFLDEKAQQAAEAVNGAGRLMPPAEETDFLAIINANLGGAKSNLFISYEVKQVVSAPENGQIEKTVEITYKNSRKADNCNLEAGELCLNSTLQDWTRLYLPKGAKLVKAQGFDSDPKEYEEEGFTVIDGFFKLEPLKAAKLVITYTVPYSDETSYRIRLWKQGGVNPFTTMMEVTGGQEEILVEKDTNYEVEF